MRKQENELHLIIYSIDDHESFKYAQDIYQELVQFRGSSIPCAICGNKCDIDESIRAVTKSEQFDLSVRIDIPVYEISALLNTNIDSVFLNLIKSIRKRNFALILHDDN